MNTLDILLLTATVALVVSIAYMIKEMLSRSKEEELERLRRENRELKRELRETEERLKHYYEGLLRDAAVKNAMMVGLWNAYKSGELSKCYEGGGFIKVLADGSVICYKKSEEESYVIKERELPEVKISIPEEEEELAKEEGEGNASSSSE